MNEPTTTYYILNVFSIYVFPQDCSPRPKHVEEIIVTKQIFMHEYLQLVGINTA